MHAISNPIIQTRVCHVLRLLAPSSYLSPFLKYKTCNFNDLEAWTRMVQGHSRSKVMVPVGSPLGVSCLTSIVSNIVSLTVFEIFQYVIQHVLLLWNDFVILCGEYDWLCRVSCLAWAFTKFLTDSADTYFILPYVAFQYILCTYW